MNGPTVNSWILPSAAGFCPEMGHQTSLSPIGPPLSSFEINELRHPRSSGPRAIQSSWMSAARTGEFRRKTEDGLARCLTSVHERQGHPGSGWPFDPDFRRCLPYILVYEMTTCADALRWYGFLSWSRTPVWLIVRRLPRTIAPSGR